MLTEPMLSGDVARAIERSDRYVRKLASLGRLRPVLRTPGGVALFERADVEAYLRDRDAA